MTQATSWTETTATPLEDVISFARSIQSRSGLRRNPPVILGRLAFWLCIGRIKVRGGKLHRQRRLKSDAELLSRAQRRAGVEFARAEEFEVAA